MQQHLIRTRFAFDLTLPDTNFTVAGLPELTPDGWSWGYIDPNIEIGYVTPEIVFEEPFDIATAFDITELNVDAFNTEETFTLNLETEIFASNIGIGNSFFDEISV